MSNGERFEPHDTNPGEAVINLERYVFAMSFVGGKVVCEAGCGAGLGTYLYSLGAKQVYAYDYKDEAFELAREYPKRPNVEFIKQNLEKDFKLKDCDLIVALEFLEHIDNPEDFLKAQTARELVFSLPKDSLAVSDWHKFDIKGEDDVRNLLVAGGYKVKTLDLQHDLWFFGSAIKYI